MTKILVTGASGFIGRECCVQLNALGYEVHAVSSKSRSDGVAHWHRLDLLSSEGDKGLIREIQPEKLLHLAWYAEPGKYWTAVDNFYWVRASLMLFENFQESGGERLVVAGSCAEYDWGQDRYNEYATPLVPETLYGTCKHSLQIMLSSYALLSGLSFAWGRVFSIYGPGENPNRLFASIIRSLLQRREIKINNGGLIRDYLHVKDVASAFVALVGSDNRGPINIGSGFGSSLDNLAGELEERIGNFGYLKRSGKTEGTDGAGAIVADTKRIRSIGWHPSFDLDSGLDDTIRWFKENQ